VIQDLRLSGKKAVIAFIDMMMVVTTVVPMHANDLDRALIRKILNDIDISIEEYNNLF